MKLPASGFYKKYKRIAFVFMMSEKITITLIHNKTHLKVGFARNISGIQKRLYRCRIDQRTLVAGCLD
ncbi:hypothetical protein AHV57_22000 [Salmonella enterica]|nr:hypothetical protein [Salmonella enterica]